MLDAGSCDLASGTLLFHTFRYLYLSFVLSSQRVCGVLVLMVTVLNKGTVELIFKASSTATIFAVAVYCEHPHFQSVGSLGCIFTWHFIPACIYFKHLHLHDEGLLRGSCWTVGLGL